MGGVADLHFAVVQIQIDRLFRNTLDKHAVKAGMAQLGAEVATGVGVVPHAGDRRFGHHHVAAAEKGAGGAHGAAHKAEHALRGENIGVGRHLVIENLRADTVTANEISGQFFAEGPHFPGVGGQVYKEQLAHVTIQHLS